MGSDDVTTLEHVPGQVWMVDFWATWCPPCQAPMAHNVEMLKKRGAEWGSDVRIIGLSIDGDKAKLKSHVESKGWEQVEHFFRGKSNASEVYSVQGVPHVMLIDKTGKIVFKGHPANRPNLEEDFDTLRNGGTISGEGCAAAEKVEGGEEPIPEGYIEMDPKELEEDIAAASAGIEELTKDSEVTEIAKQCPRAFCVLVVDQQYSPATGKTLVKYECYKVLVGSQENIDKLKAKIDEKVKGKFKVVLREQVM
jgi:thiol-disulfide isomerase/thioredoxin